MRVVFLGPPGVGKGTQADHVVLQYQLTKISTGDLLREAVINRSVLGLAAKSYMDQGQLVPDIVVVNLVREKIVDPGCASGFILDGFPRTVLQAEELSKMLENQAIALDRVVKFEIAREEIVLRLSGRRNCQKCHAIYHVDFAKPKVDGICDRCGELLMQRSDDGKKEVETRLKVYEVQTAPLVHYYNQRELLSPVDASGPVSVVFNRLSEVLRPYQAK